MKKLVIALALVAASATSASAGVPITYSSNTETAGFVGIQVDLSDMQPEIIGGVRYTKTDTSNDVTGAKADIAIPVMGDMPFVPTFRVMGVMGSTEVQGEAGLGYDFATENFLLGVGAQGPYVNGGINFEFDGSLHPYIGANTLEDAPHRKEEALIP